MVANAQGADTDKLLGLAAHSSIARTLSDTNNQPSLATLHTI